MLFNGVVVLSTQPTWTLPYHRSGAEKHTSTSRLFKISRAETLFWATEETEDWANRLNGNEHLFISAVLFLPLPNLV